MTPIRLHAALIIVTVVLSSCSRKEAPAESAAAPAPTGQLEAEVGKRFRRPELQGYPMLPDSFVGGSFPKEIAVLLREVEELESKYVSLLQESSTRTQPVIQAHQAFEQFARVTAELARALQPDGVDRLSQELTRGANRLPPRLPRGHALRPLRTPLTYASAKFRFSIASSISAVLL